MTDSILVTGASGFLGRAVLTELGNSRRIHALVREMPLRPLPDNVLAVVQDLRQPFEFQIPERPSTIVHLAQSPRYRDFPDGALDVFRVNVEATQRLLDWGRRSGVKRFIYASSGAVYGHGERAFDEDTSIDGVEPLAHYAASKRCGELLAESYRGEMTIIVLRFFFIYGPEQGHGMLVPRLVESVLHERPIMLQGNHGIRLNPVFVSDAVAAVQAALELETSENINVAGPQVLTLRELGTLIGEATRNGARFEVDSNAVPKHLIGSIRKMTLTLGAPRTGMAEGLRHMVVATSHAMASELKD